MRLAYSVECNAILTADEAYENFWRGRIANEAQFICPDPRCSATATCAYLSESRLGTDAAPNFIWKKKHKKGCQYARNKMDMFLGSGDRPDDNSRQCDTFVSGYAEKAALGAAFFNTLTPRVHDATYCYSVRTLLNNYVMHRKSGLGGERPLNVDEYRLTYEDMFVPIDSCDISEATRFKRIYFGEAVVAESTSAYVMEFADKFLLRGDASKVSLKISKKMVQADSMRSLFLARMKYILEQEAGRGMIYVYAEPQVSISEDKWSSEVRFVVPDLNHFEARFVRPAHQ
jgi:hypothetical protein